MSLPRFGEDKKPKEPKPTPPIPPKPQKEPKQQTAYFTREQMIKEAERIRREYEQSRKAQRQGAAVMESQKTRKQETPLPELDAIEMRVREIAQEIGVSSVDAPRDDGKPTLDGSKCVGCHLCLIVCPERAIGTAKKRVQRR